MEFQPGSDPTLGCDEPGRYAFVGRGVCPRYASEVDATESVL
jgi:hypothetical protein